MAIQNSINNIEVPDTLYTAKGDLVVGTGSSAQSTLNIGSNGQVLTADSAESVGVKWATPSLIQFPWNVTSTNGDMTTGNGYMITNTTTRVVLGLPSSPSIGNVVKVYARYAAGWKINAYTGHYIRFGNQVSTSGGYIQSTDVGDCVELLYYNNYWHVVSGVGNITIA